MRLQKNETEIDSVRRDANALKVFDQIFGVAFSRGSTDFFQNQNPYVLILIDGDALAVSCGR
jgi:hypothetical protein